MCDARQQNSGTGIFEVWLGSPPPLVRTRVYADDPSRHLNRRLTRSVTIRLTPMRVNVPLPAAEDLPQPFHEILDTGNRFGLEKSRDVGPE